MNVKAEKVPIAWALELTIRALIPEFRQLRDLLEENKTFVPDLIPLLEELNLALTGWSAPIEGPCGYKPNEDYIGPHPLPEVHTGPLRSY